MKQEQQSSETAPRKELKYFKLGGIAFYIIYSFILLTATGDEAEKSELQGTGGIRTADVEKTEPQRSEPIKPVPEIAVPKFLSLKGVALPGREVLALNDVEFVAIEGLDHDPNRIYKNPDCIYKLSKDSFAVEEVEEQVDGVYVPASERFRELQEAREMMNTQASPSF